MKDKLRLGIDVRYTTSGVKQEGLVDGIVSHIEDYDLDIYLGPEFLFVEEFGVNHVYDEYGKDEVFGEIVDRTKDRDGLFMPGSMVWHKEGFIFNTIPLIVEGKITEYHKRTDAGSTSFASAKEFDGTFYNGKDDLIMNWKDYSVGISICADRAYLANYIKTEKLPLLDLYFLSSCGVTLDEGFTPVKKGGFGICADGSVSNSKLESEVWKSRDTEDWFDSLDPDTIVSRVFEPSNIDTSGFNEYMLECHKLDEKRREKNEEFHIYELDVRCLKKK